MTHVLVCGGGIAGLTAAHELSNRGIKVTVLEQREQVGGKARSIGLPWSEGTAGKPLPGEHGFRFFPGFYKHLDETMAQIPYGNNKRGVLDNLRPATEMLLSRAFALDIELPSEPPENLSEALAFFRAFSGTLGISFRDSLFFARKMLSFLSSCSGRRDSEFDNISWWDFISAENRSEGYQRFLGQGVTRSLVAMKAEVSSTRTIGAIYFQMVSHLINPGSDVDRLLNGPTNEVWLDPWKEHLVNQGVEFIQPWSIDNIYLKDDKVSGISAKKNGKGRRKIFKADNYIIALPMEVISELLSPDLLELAPCLGKIKNLKTEWMNGIQFFLDEDIEISKGHGLYLDSPWALTSISQAQFWDSDLSEYGEGNCKGILSIVISDWKAPGVIYDRAAEDCTAEEIREEVWEQLRHHLDSETRTKLNQIEVLDWFLDPAIVQPNNHETINLEPLLINTTGSWEDRPNADIGIENCFLASDYVRTFTDLATMESANEAAKRAVNEILKREGKQDLCNIMPMIEWDFLKPLKKFDAYRFKKGKKNLFS